MFDRLDCVCIHTGDLDRSLRFYLAMGMRQAWRLDRTTDAGVPWTLVGLDFPDSTSSQLTLSTHPDRTFIELEIRVEDVHAAFDELSRNPDVRFVVEPFAIEDGHVAVLEAPDGNQFVLIGK